LAQLERDSTATFASNGITSGLRPRVNREGILSAVPVGASVSSIGQRRYNKALPIRAFGESDMSARRGFTLIGLLVVIAIIGSLVAILMPALAGARARTRLTVCATNLRELGIGLSSYMRDSGDIFPYVSYMPSISSAPLVNVTDPIYLADVLQNH